MEAKKMTPAEVGAGVTVVTTLAKESWNCFKPHFDYVKDLDDNYEKLRSEYGYHSAVKKDMDEQISRSTNAMRTTARCDHVLSNVRSTQSKFQDLEAKYQKAKNTRCLCGVWPFRKLRKLGKQIVETKDKVVRESAEMKELVKERRVMIERRLEQVATDIHDLDALTKNVHELLKYLGKYKRIGISGCPGVGKTTLLKKLLAEAKKNGRFGEAILITVEGNDGERKIRADLLEWLKLSVNDIDSRDDDVAVANKISETLEKMKYLLLLDHVYSEIDLDKVGIRRCHEHGKVVVASSQLLRRKIGVDEYFDVRTLDKNDARTLFLAIVGDVVNRHQGIKQIAEQIVEQLGGVPRLIRAMATELQNEKNEYEWRRKLVTLQSVPECKQENLADKFNILRLVYGELRVDRRRCLLYAALFPRDHEIYVDYLVECWRAEGFISVVQGINVPPFSAARDEGHHILKNFIESGLLENCQRVKHIKMPDEHRKFAHEEFYPEDEDYQSLVEFGKEEEQDPADEQIEEHPPEEKWRNTRRISLMRNRMRSLPRSPKCRNLSTLLLQRNKYLTDIPKSFFAHMSRLQMLDLFKTEIKALPPSMFSLINLKGLYLNACCNLKVLSPKIAKLQNLEVLDIRCTGICSLPVEIGQLNNLKCFRFSFLCNSGDSPTLTTPRYNILRFWKREQQKVIIPPNLVKKLCNLEELTIMVDPNEPTWNAIANGIAQEVASLKVLTNLCFHFPGVESLATFINSRTDGIKNFISYKVLVGYHGTDNRDGLNSSIDSAERLLRYSAGHSIPEEIIKVLKQATAFELIGHDSVQSLSDFGMENMKSMGVCVIEECNEMRSIVDGDNVVVGTVSPALEELHVMNLQQLNCIWRGPVVPEVLANLRTLTLNGCPILTKVLSNGITQHLQQLQCLRVENCCQITEIIEADIILSGALPKLETLELVNLPKLVSIAQSDTLGWPCLEKIVIKRCPALRNLSLSTTNAPELMSISCNEQWWEILQQSLPDGLRQRIMEYCQFQFSEENQPPPGHGVVPQQNGPASSSMNNAAAGPSSSRTE